MDFGDVAFSEETVTRHVYIVYVYVYVYVSHTHTHTQSGDATHIQGGEDS